MLQDPVNQFPSDLGGYFSGCRLVVVVVAVVGGGAFPGECPPPPGFSWDLRMKRPLSAPSPHPVPHPFHYSVGVLGARNEWEEGRAWNCTRESE